MTIRYDDVKPWGRSFDEYVRMFGLTPGDLDKTILGCGDGPASFNAEMYAGSRRIVSVDPIYRYSEAELRQRIRDTYDDVIGQTRRNAEKFVWDEIGSVEALGERRMAAMGQFLGDYETGRGQGRYVEGELPALPFGHGAFDLALCSHLLFLYTDNLSLDFHLAAVDELCRVAREVRIFPLLDTNAHRSAYLDQVISHMATKGLHVAEEQVPYEFQRGGNHMLRIMRSKAHR